MDLDGALGLRYSSLQWMSSVIINEVVAAWLNEKDHVLTVSGPPSWGSLARALEDIDQHGLAHRILEGTSIVCGVWVGVDGSGSEKQNQSTRKCPCDLVT